MANFNSPQSKQPHKQADKQTFVEQKFEQKGGLNLKQNQISQNSKKGKTLGAQHASHGDSGVSNGKSKSAKK